MIGKTVATPSAGPLAGHISSNTPEIRLVTTADYDETLELLLDGIVDAAALNLQVGSGLVNGKYPNKVTLPSHPFFELPLAVVTLKGKFPDLIENINVGLNSMRQDGSLQEAIDHWKTSAYH